jgi:hypothetical protein
MKPIAKLEFLKLIDYWSTFLIQNFILQSII